MFVIGPGLLTFVMRNFNILWLKSLRQLSTVLWRKYAIAWLAWAWELKALRGHHLWNGLGMCRACSSENIDIMMLTETDTQNLLNEESYIIQGYKTILPLKSTGCDLVRIVCLVKDCLFSSIKLRSDLMSDDFPSIWLI